MYIKKLRKLKNKTQKELSEEIGINQSAISHIERGLRSPSIQTAQALAKALDCTIDDLFKITEEDESEK